MTDDFKNQTEQSQDIFAEAKSSSEAKHMVTPKEETAGSFFKSLLIDVVIAIVLAAIVLFFIRPTIVKQSSMEDTLHENDYMILYRQAYRSHGPERGDIIVFRSELPDETSGTSKLLIKRVIGLPGDKISIVDDQLYINGEYYPEDYLKDGYTPAFEIPQEGDVFTVPEGFYYVMGDNRVGSIDSRRKEVGCVPSDVITGKVVLRLFPFSQIQRF